MCSSLRSCPVFAAQLTRGSTPRAEQSHKVAVTAQREIAERKVVPLRETEDSGPRRTEWSAWSRTVVAGGELLSHLVRPLIPATNPVGLSVHFVSLRIFFARSSAYSLPSSPITNTLRFSESMSTASGHSRPLARDGTSVI